MCNVHCLDEGKYCYPHDSIPTLWLTKIRNHMEFFFQLTEGGGGGGGGGGWGGIPTQNPPTQNPPKFKETATVTTRLQNNTRGQALRRLRRGDIYIWSFHSCYYYCIKARSFKVCMMMTSCNFKPHPFLPILMTDFEAWPIFSWPSRIVKLQYPITRQSLNVI